MAHFTKTRVGGWISLSTLLSTEMADIDNKTFAAVNGDAGGTWAPSGTGGIVIGGNGLTLATSVVFGASSTTVFTSGASVAGTINPASQLVFTGTNGVAFSSSLLEMIGGSALRLDTGSSISALAGSNINVFGTHTIEGTGFLNVLSGGFLSLQSGSFISMLGTAAMSFAATATLTFTAGATVAGAFTRTAGETRSGNGAFTAERFAVLTDLDQTIHGEQHDVLRIPNAVGSGRVYTLATSPTPPTGHKVRFFRRGNTTNQAQIADDSPTQVCAISAGSPGQAWCDIMWDGSEWTTVAFGTVGTAAVIPQQ